MDVQSVAGAEELVFFINSTFFLNAKDGAIL